MPSNFAPGQGGILTGLQALSGYGTPNFAPPAGPPTAVPALQTPAYNYQGGTPRVPIGGQFNQLTQHMAGPIYAPLGSTWNAQLPQGTLPTPGGMPSVPGQNAMPIPQVNTPAPVIPPPVPPPQQIPTPGQYAPWQLRGMRNPSAITVPPSMIGRIGRNGLRAEYA